MKIASLYINLSFGSSNDHPSPTVPAQTVLHLAPWAFHKSVSMALNLRLVIQKWQFTSDLSDYRDLSVQSVHLTLPHEFRGRSDRDLSGFTARLTSCPRTCRIADQADYGPRILPERLESTWCHQDLPADQADPSPLYPTSKAS
ncbi:F-box family protein with DUF295 [Prunus dulcis]|uniref:F-box family protein with DUF295 n=1 Tax=Prunus dulcis TaxID=3755 RepID=A0A4Y1QS12_PRUDU|nr:F-box family protein with DUF295 [Prunus dulcis]